VRKADLSLKADIVVETALDDVRASQRVLSDRDASRLDKAFRKADALVLVTELGHQTGMNITLEVTGIEVNIARQFTTFIQRIHAVLVLLWEVFILYDYALKAF
jgi:hypothetical protein